MKKYILLLIVVFQTYKSIAQNKQIRYVLPDQVEILLDSIIKKSKTENAHYYFLIKKDSIYSITMGSYIKRKQNVLKWVRQSNRFIIIHNNVYPLIFDYDLKFGAIDFDNIGKFGNREDNVKRVSLMLHGITIYFKSDGTIVKMEN